jgi:hypothetical protein
MMAAYTANPDHKGKEQHVIKLETAGLDKIVGM